MTIEQDRNRQNSLLPMGSIYEESMFMLFEMMVQRVQALRQVSPEAIRASHTNME